MECIFEAYDQFVSENRDSLSNIKDVTSFITDPLKRESLYEALIGNIEDQDVRTNLKNLFEAETNTILTEGANVGGSSFATPWAVSMHPILFDIYHDSTIIQCATTYPVSKGTITIPRMRTKATTTDFDGNTFVEQFIPYPARLARPNLKENLITPGSSPFNLFTGSAVDRSKFKINRTHTFLKSIQITETTAANAITSQTYEVWFDFNARSVRL
jgi:hypothetical protein